ncbi:hypothetical protein [Schaedlerella sp.]|uniref:hypothetical protein n=1 Tax=Schaedlerella sp. TaxID=2676057 RepID=UPI0035292A73
MRYMSRMYMTMESIVAAATTMCMRNIFTNLMSIITTTESIAAAAMITVMKVITTTKATTMSR